MADGFDAWDKQFTVQVDVLKDVHEAALGDAVGVLFDEIKDRTPVGNPALWKWPAPADYNPGTLKASWEQHKLSPLAYEIINDQPYAYRVETGWSTQAPEGMMRVSIKDWPFILDQAMKRNVRGNV